MTATIRLTVAQAIIRFLQLQYTERDGITHRAVHSAFAIFGHGNVLGLGQAIIQDGNSLPLYQPKNEQSMVHVAIGYAKAARRLQTIACSASIGPGATNMLTGAATATTNRLPVLLLPADTFVTRRGGPVLQQLEHPISSDESVNDMFRTVSRFYDRISRPEQILTALPEAMRVLFDPADTGAVTISLPQDVQSEAYDYPVAFFEPRTWHVSRRPTEPEQLAAAVDLINAAQRPLIIAGGGVRYSEAEPQLAQLAHAASIPVAETSAGKGSLTRDSSWLLGGIGVNGTAAAAEIAREADLVICAGTRLSDFTTGSHSLFQNPDVRFVGLNVNAADAYKLSATPLISDAREGLRALTAAVKPTNRSAYRQTVDPVRRRWQTTVDAHRAISPIEGRIGQAQVIATLNQAVSDGDWVVAAAGYQPGDLLKLWDTPPGSFSHIEFAYSCMGHEIPAGIGIRLHQPDTGEIIVVIGDGTYLMCPSEIATAVQEHLKLTILILDNGGYQSINGLASGNLGVSAGNEFRVRAGDRLPNGDYLAIDYAANARSLGAHALTATSTRQLAEALTLARSTPGTTVIVCQTSNEPVVPPAGVFWDLAVPEAAADASTREQSANVIAGRSQQRSYLW